MGESNFHSLLPQMEKPPAQTVELAKILLPCLNQVSLNHANIVKFNWHCSFFFVHLPQFKKGHFSSNCVLLNYNLGQFVHLNSTMYIFGEVAAVLCHIVIILQWFKGDTCFVFERKHTTKFLPQGQSHAKRLYSQPYSGFCLRNERLWGSGVTSLPVRSIRHMNYFSFLVRCSSMWAVDSNVTVHCGGAESAPCCYQPTSPRCK